MTEKEAISIVEEYRKKFPELSSERLIRIQYCPQFKAQGEKAWIITYGVEIFGDVKEFFYVVSERLYEVEYVFDEYGNINPHLPKPIPKEWEKFIDDDE